MCFSTNEGGSFSRREMFLVWVEAAIIAALSMALSWIRTLLGGLHRRGEQLFLLFFHYAAGLTPGLQAGLLWGITPLCSR